MSGTDQQGDNTKQEAASLFGLWVITMIVAIIFISSLSTRTPVEGEKSAAAEHAQTVAPPLDAAQTMAPLPAGHPSIEQLQAEAQPQQTPELPPGHPPLESLSAPAQDAPAAAEEHAAHETTHWGYEGEGGPDQWGAIKADYRACGVGTQQSPINIDTKKAIAARVGDIVFDYKPSPLEIVNNGHTVQVNFAPGSSILFKGKRFELLQFHFHSPSEHQIDYHYADMEAHLVHKSADGELAVIGVMLKRGEDNPLMEKLWKHFPRETNQSVAVAGGSINAMDLLPANRNSYYHYMGSLTTPPCSEIVHWIVMREPVGVTTTQVTTFVDALGENNRPVQPLHRRHVVVNAQ